MFKFYISSYWNVIVKQSTKFKNFLVMPWEIRYIHPEYLYRVKICKRRFLSLLGVCTLRSIKSKGSRAAWKRRKSVTYKIGPFGYDFAHDSEMEYDLLLVPPPNPYPILALRVQYVRAGPIDRRESLETRAGDWSPGKESSRLCTRCFDSAPRYR